VVGAWVVGGVAILAVAWWRRGHPAPGGGRDLVEITWKMAVIIGFMQCVAMWPGTSRSLMTIVGGVMVGLSLSAAVEFSFLLGVVTLTAATLKKAVWPVSGGGEAYDTLFGGFQLMWDQFGQVNMIVGVAAATVSAAIAVKWMVGYLQKHGMSLFGWYRIGIGVAVAGMIMAGMIEA
jgi:undecaprenyl-diphosphatase